MLCSPFVNCSDTAEEDGRNYVMFLMFLQVLETAVKNCGRRFHGQVATKHFMGELIKIIGPKNDPPQAVQEKVLSLIQVRQGAQSHTDEKVLSLIQMRRCSVSYR